MERTFYVATNGVVYDIADRGTPVPVLQEFARYIQAERETAAVARRPLPTAAVPTLRDKTAEERKAEPVYSGVLMYFPDALAAIARLSKSGNDKHNPGEPLHWARGKSTDQMDCAIRHSLTPQRIDAETKEPELVAMVWRGLAELQLLEEKRNRQRGVRSYLGL